MPQDNRHQPPSGPATPVRRRVRERLRDRRFLKVYPLALLVAAAYVLTGSFESRGATFWFGVIAGSVFLILNVILGRPMDRPSDDSAGERWLRERQEKRRRERDSLDEMAAK